jgi:hypothetical protein
VAGVYVDVQIPDDNVQEAGLNVPPALLSLNNSVPDGVVGGLELSTTVTVSVTGVAEFMVDEFGVTIVAVEWIWFTVKDVDPELAEWEESLP